VGGPPLRRLHLLRELLGSAIVFATNPRPDRGDDPHAMPPIRTTIITAIATTIAAPMSMVEVFRMPDASARTKDEVPEATGLRR
jgi:hypothetical protein